MRRPRMPRPTWRHLWLVPGLAIAFYANGQSGLHGLGLAPVLIFGIVPHLPVLLGRGQPHAPGQLARRAVPLFNAMHHPVAPLALLAVAATGALSPFWLVGAIAWLSHIVVDWAMGDGLRSADGFRLDRSIWAGRPFALRVKGAARDREPGVIPSGDSSRGVVPQDSRVRLVKRRLRWLASRWACDGRSRRLSGAITNVRRASCSRALAGRINPASKGAHSRQRGIGLCPEQPVRGPPRLRAV